MPTATPGRRRSPAERVAQITDMAEAIARDEGLAALSLRSLGASVGVAPSLIAHYEPSMDALVARTFDRLARRELEDVRAICDAAGGPAQRLHALVDAVADPSRDDVAAAWADAWALGRRNAELAAAARARMDDWQHLASGIVREGRDAGVFPVGDPEEVGLLLFALIDAVSAYALVDYRDRGERNALVRRTLEQAVGLAPGAFGA